VKPIHLICFLTFLAGTASLNGADLTLSGNSDPMCNPAIEICLTGPSFNITVDPSGGGFFQLDNVTSGIINELDFSIPYPDANCATSGNPGLPTLNIVNFSTFDSTSLKITQSSNCDPVNTGVADYSVILDFLPGIPNNTLFDVNLNNGSQDQNGVGGWLANTVTSDTDSSAPEPGTLAAAVAGLLLVYLLRQKITALTS